MAEKPAVTEAMENALGPLWCPMKGIKVKELGDNKFLFTFLQSSGKRKAVDNGPWMFDKNLLVMEEFDASKTIDEYSFNMIPIWVRVFKLPLGDMDRETGELIGNQIGEFLEVDGLDGGMAVGQSLRIKVRMPITKPIMRGTMVEVEGGRRTIWCPFEYEYCPDFCFICGMIGHVEKECSKKLKKGEEPQFGRWLKWVPPRRNYLVENRRSWGSGGSRSQGSGGSSGGRARSDAPSWRRTEAESGKGSKIVGSEKEVTSPLKILGANVGTGGKSAQKGLCFDDLENQQQVKEVDEKGGEVVVDESLRGGAVAAVSGVEEGKGVKEGVCEGGEGRSEEPKGEEQKMVVPPKQGKFKRIARSEKKVIGVESQVKSGVKRGGEEMEVDTVSKSKKKRSVDVEMVEGASETNIEAGLSEQLRGTQ
jgi:hypothetical protein